MKTAVNTDILCLTICDVINKVPMCGLCNVMSRPLLFFYSTLVKSELHPEQQRFKGENDSFRPLYIFTWGHTYNSIFKRFKIHIPAVLL